MMTLFAWLLKRLTVVSQDLKDSDNNTRVHQMWTSPKWNASKCGKKGHFMKEYPQARFMTPQYQSRSSFAGSSPGQHSYKPKSESSYHHKYKAQKAHFAQMQQDMNDKVEQLTKALKSKGVANQVLIAKMESEWVDSDASSVESDGED